MAAWKNEIEALPKASEVAWDENRWKVNVDTPFNRKWSGGQFLKLQQDFNTAARIGILVLLDLTIGHLHSTLANASKAIKFLSLHYTLQLFNR